MVAHNHLRRIDRGLYDLPRINPLTGKPTVPDYHRVIDAVSRRDLFLATANRLGTTLQNIEKDFWVSWMLDLLFNGRDVNEPRLLFKGGTSLSDVDITVFREDIGQNIETNDLKYLSGKKERAYLEAIKNACQTYINGILKDRLT